MEPTQIEPKGTILKPKIEQSTIEDCYSAQQHHNTSFKKLGLLVTIQEPQQSQKDTAQMLYAK